MNTNFFNQRKSLRAFQSGGSMPQREQFNSEPEYDAAMESYLNSAGTPSVASSFVGPQDNSTQNVTPPIVVPQNQPQTAAPAQTQAIPGYQGASIVDFLKSMGVDSSKANRRKLANLSGNDDYNMSGDENAALMDYVRKNMQGKDKIRNNDGNIVALDGSGQVPMTIDALDHLNRTGSLPPEKKQKADSFLRQGTPEYNARAMELFGNKSTSNASANGTSNAPISFNNSQYKGGLNIDNNNNTDRGSLGADGEIHYDTPTSDINRMSNIYENDGSSLLDSQKSDNVLYRGLDMGLTNLDKTGLNFVRTLTGNARGTGDYVETALSLIPSAAGFLSGLGKKEANIAAQKLLENFSNTRRELPPAQSMGQRVFNMGDGTIPTSGRTFYQDLPSQKLLGNSSAQKLLTSSKMSKLEKLYNKQIKSPLRFNNE